MTECTFLTDIVKEDIEESASAFRGLHVSHHKATLLRHPNIHLTIGREATLTTWPNRIAVDLLMLLTVLGQSGPITYQTRYIQA